MKTFITILSLLSISLSTFSQNPNISGFSPDSGSVGTLVTVSGSNLGNPTAFSIGGVSAILVSGTNDTIIGMIMPGAVSGAVSVTTSSGIATSNGFTITPTPFPHIQQGPKLSDTTARSAEQGRAVSISADGNTAIIGGTGYPVNNYATGAAWIYTRTAGVWSQQGTPLLGSPATIFPAMGFSVAISADGNTALIGAPQDSNDVGSAFVYVRNGGIWTQQGSRLASSGSVNVPQSYRAVEQGYSVSLSADGNTAILGAPYDNDLKGAAWVFVRAAGTWTQQGPKLTGRGPGGPVEYGWSVALSGDGNTALIGSIQDSNNTGGAFIYTRSNGIWTQQGPELVGTGYTAGNTFGVEQGYSVALSADGNTALIGAINDDNSIGAAWVFTRLGTTWTQQGGKLVGTGSVGTYVTQGRSVSLSADGNTAIVGATGGGSGGGIWIYTRSAGVWTQQGNRLTGTGSILVGGQGSSVSLSADGTTAIEGGADGNNGSGAAWIFTTGVCPILSSYKTQSICQGSAYVFNGQYLSIAGIYKDTMNSLYGCDSVVTLNLTVNQNSRAAISRDICQGTSYNFDGRNLSAAGTYYDTLVAVSGCDSIVSLSLSVHPKPVMSWSQTDTMICQQSGTLSQKQFTSYIPTNGTFSGADVSGDSLYPTALGIYTVTYTCTNDAFGCSNSISKQFDFEICTDITYLTPNQNLLLYPNPNSGKVTLAVNKALIPNDQYRITDILGNTILQGGIKSEKQTIDLTDASNGVYFLKVNSGPLVKFVIMR